MSILDQARELSPLLAVERYPVDGRNLGNRLQTYPRMGYAEGRSGAGLFACRGEPSKEKRMEVLEPHFSGEGLRGCAFLGERLGNDQQHILLRSYSAGMSWVDTHEPWHAADARHRSWPPPLSIRVKNYGSAVWFLLSRLPTLPIVI